MRHRRSARDPRSSLELRRLAFKAQRSTAAREVLLDALLESDNRTEEWMRHARNAADSNGVTTFLIYYPSTTHVMFRHHTSRLPGERIMIRGRFELSDTRSMKSPLARYKGADPNGAIVYIAKPSAGAPAWEQRDARKRRRARA